MNCVKCNAPIAPPRHTARRAHHSRRGRQRRDVAQALRALLPDRSWRSQRNKSALLVQPKLQFLLYKEGEARGLKTATKNQPPKDEGSKPPLDRLSVLSLSRGEVAVKPCYWAFTLKYLPCLLVQPRIIAPRRKREDTHEPD